MASEDARTMAAEIIKAYVGCPSGEQFDAYQDGMSEYLDREMFTERDALKAALLKTICDLRSIAIKNKESGPDSFQWINIWIEEKANEAEALLNPIDYGAEKRDDKAREHRQAMSEARQEADHAETS